MHTNLDVDKHRKRYIALSVTIFTLAGLAHLLRLIYGWDFILGSYHIPISLSIFAVIATLLMIIMGSAYLRR